MTLLTDTIGTTYSEIAMKLEIKHRYTGAVLFECELPEEIAELSADRRMGYAIKEAVKARADLAGAYLAGADLAGAYLAGADLADARNAPPGAQATDPPEPYVRATKPEHYANRAERYRQRNPDVPVIAALDRKMLEVIESGKGALNMSQWHTCETTHCRAGWAITLAGEAGKKLESERGPAVAGRMIYLASTGRAPHFYATNDRAMEDIKARAAEQL